MALIPTTDAGSGEVPLTKKILLGVSGGVAAYKSAEIVRRLRDLSVDVTVCPTASALKFVGEPTWAALSGNPIVVDMWQRTHEVTHVSTARTPDAILVAPASADLMARVAAGRADDVLSAILLMARCPIVMAPAMHTEMWLHPATQQNVTALRARGVLVLEPDSGRLTGPDSGPGRLPAPESLADIAVLAATDKAQDLAGLRIVVSAGGTREALDPVRWIGNRSSGRMGYAIAAAAVARGAHVTVVAANVELADVAGATTVAVGSHAQLAAAMASAIADADVVLMAAAVADYSSQAQAEKIKKPDLSTPLTLELAPTSDILRSIVAARSGRRPYIVGFAAETSATQLQALAEQKLLAKGCDAIVANDVTGGAVFADYDTSAVVVTAAGLVSAIPHQSKLSAAHAILDIVQAERS